MTVNILSLYKKTWPGKNFSVSFLHDSIRCEHCLKGKINIEPEIKKKSEIQCYDPPTVEDLSKSCFHQTHLRSFMTIKHNSIPRSSFSTLGVKLTKSVAAKLNQHCDVKKPFHGQYRKKHNFKSLKSACNTKKSLNKKFKKCSKKEIPPAEPLINKINIVKEQKIPLKKPISPAKLTKKEPLVNERGNLKKLEMSSKKKKSPAKLRKKEPLVKERIVKKIAPAKLRKKEPLVKERIEKERNTISKKKIAPAKLRKKEPLVKERIVKKINTSAKKKMAPAKLIKKEPLVKEGIGKKINTTEKKIMAPAKLIKKEPFVKETIVKKRNSTSKKEISPAKLRKIVKDSTKGTLEFERWHLKKFKQTNHDYEDDLFEDQDFGFPDIPEYDSDPEKFDGMRTPDLDIPGLRDSPTTSDRDGSSSPFGYGSCCPFEFGKICPYSDCSRCSHGRDDSSFLSYSDCGSPGELISDSD